MLKETNKTINLLVFRSNVLIQSSANEQVSTFSNTKNFVEKVT